jgi:3-methyladenine DNA glycosylase AlkD
MSTRTIRARLRELADAETARFLQGFFKTGPGQYGAGDRFLGIKVPALRALAREHQDLAPRGVETLLQSPWHEKRLLALLILVRAFSRGDEASRQQVYELYVKNLHHVNNWDLVDGSAEHIIGPFLRERSREFLYRLAASNVVWERRIAIQSTFHFIRHHDFADTLRLAALLLSDREDLIHKAVGWMLREVGKRDLAAEEGFLLAHYRRMPRTMLRYAIERFPEDRRQGYLKGEI